MIQECQKLLPNPADCDDLTSKLSMGAAAQERVVPLEVVPPPEVKKRPIDDLLEDTIGSFGKFQCILLFLVCGPIMSFSIQVMSWTFVSSDQIYPGNSSVFHLWNIEPENRPPIKATIQSCYFFGQLVGSYVTGIMGDHYGRKTTVFICLIIQSICGLLLAVAPNWWLFSLLKFGTGFTQNGLYSIPILYTLEILGKDHRRLSVVTLTIFYSSGMLAIPLGAYLIRDQRIYHAILAIPSFLFTLYWWALPESPRWLVAKGRLEEAERIVRRAAKMNDRPFPDNWSSMIDTSASGDDPPSPGLLPLFKTPEMRKRILISTVLWPTTQMLYYGFTMKSDLNGGSLYVSFVLVCIFEIPGACLSYFLINILGRRLLGSMSYFICALLLLLNWGLASIAPHYVLLTFLLLASIAACCVDISNYTHLPEMMPTLLRTTATGYCSAVSRFGAILSSYIAYWLVDAYGMAALIIPFTVFSMISAVLTQFCLPETFGHPLPETVEDVERKKHT